MLPQVLEHLQKNYTAPQYTSLSHTGKVPKKVARCREGQVKYTRVAHYRSTNGGKAKELCQNETSVGALKVQRLLARLSENWGWCGGLAYLASICQPQPAIAATSP